MLERRIDDSSKVIDIGIFRDIDNQTKNKPRLCPVHNENVSQKDENFSEVPQSIVTPLPSVVFSGCCDNAIDPEFEFIDSTLREHRKNTVPKVIGL